MSSHYGIVPTQYAQHRTHPQRCEHFTESIGHAQNNKLILLARNNIWQLYKFYQNWPKTFSVILHTDRQTDRHIDQKHDHLHSSDYIKVVQHKYLYVKDDKL